MGRKRTIDRDGLLNAAETVVRRDGAARLTLDAVAAEAGISKSSVLYACDSKDHLVRAVVDRLIAQKADKARDARARLGDRPNAAIIARIAMAAHTIDEQDREVIVALHAAMVQDPGVLDPFRALFDGWIDEVRQTSPTPDGAMLAFLAVEGLQSLERFGLHRFDPALRARLLNDIEWLAGQTPLRRNDEDRDGDLR